MNKLLVLACIIVALAIPASAQKAKEWVKYTSAEGHYTVDLPLLPKVTEQEASDASGRPLKQYLASADDGSGVFIIGYFDNNGGVYSMDKGRDGMISRVKGTLVSEESIMLGKSPGRELKVIAPASDGSIFVVRARFYDTGTRIFILQYLSQKSQDSPAVDVKAKKFFDSFEVTK